MEPLLAPHPSALYINGKGLFIAEHRPVPWTYGFLSTRMGERRLFLLVSPLGASRVWRNEGALRQNNKTNTSWSSTIMSTSPPPGPSMSLFRPACISEKMTQVRFTQKPGIFRHDKNIWLLVGQLTGTLAKHPSKMKKYFLKLYIGLAVFFSLFVFISTLTTKLCLSEDQVTISFQHREVLKVRSHTERHLVPGWLANCLPGE